MGSGSFFAGSGVGALASARTGGADTFERGAGRLRHAWMRGHERYSPNAIRIDDGTIDPTTTIGSRHSRRRSTGGAIGGGSDSSAIAGAMEGNSISRL